MQIGAAKENELFFKGWLRSPKAVGSIAPSSKYLARAMAAELDLKPDHWVIELGGGTGSISEGLLERGVPRDRLLVVELDPDMHAFLKRRLHGVRVVEGDATKLDAILQDQGIDKVAGVICGLPMVGMGHAFQRAIYQQCFAALPEGGAVIQYTYSPFSPVKAAPLGLRAEMRRGVLFNFPPAFVWRYTKRTNGA